MEYLIKSIIKITNQIYYADDNISSEELYLWGGCYEFIRIIQELIEDVTIWIDDINRHCVFEFDGQLYDASGLVRENLEVYRPATDEDLELIKCLFGERIKGLKLYNNVIAKIHEMGSTKGEIVKRLIREELENSTKRAR